MAFSTLTFNNRKINGYKYAKVLVLKLHLATEAPTGLRKHGSLGLTPSTSDSASLQTKSLHFYPASR